jgi:hypothetical protein
MSKLSIDQMIDKETRLKAHNALKRFLACEIDSNDYDCEYPSHAKLFGPANPDRAIKAIADMSWYWYDDLSPHKLEGEHKLDTEAQDLAERCCAFLASDYEYEWRETKFVISGFPAPQLTTLGLVRTGLPLMETIASHLDQPEGDASVWPFFRRSDFIAAKQHLEANIRN